MALFESYDRRNMVSTASKTQKKSALRKVLTPIQCVKKRSLSASKMLAGHT